MFNSKDHAVGFDLHAPSFEDSLGAWRERRRAKTDAEDRARRARLARKRGRLASGAVPPQTPEGDCGDGRLAGVQGGPADGVIPSGACTVETEQPLADFFEIVGQAEPVLRSEDGAGAPCPLSPPLAGGPGPCLPPVIPMGSTSEAVDFADPEPDSPFSAEPPADPRALSVRGPSIPAQNEGSAPDAETDPEAEEGVDLGLARNLSRQFVSAELRARLVRAFPMMGTDGAEGQAACRLVAYLAFGSWLSETTGRLVLGNQTLADVAGVPLRPASVRPDGTLTGAGRWEPGHRWRSGNDFLAWAQTWIPGLDVTAWNGAAGFAREVRSTGFSADLEAAVSAERLTPPRERLRPVSLLDGRGFGARRQAQARSAARDALEARAAVVPTTRPSDHLSERVIRLNNGGSPTLLRSTVTAERIAEGFAVAATMAPAAQRQTVAHLDALDVSTKQLLKPVTNSVRPYPDGPGLNGLAGAPRAAVLSDLHGVDWAKAQFAVNAWAYGIGPVMDALGGGGIDWRRFTAAMGVDHTAETKGLVKDATYALNFGGSDAEVVGTLTGVRPWRLGDAGWRRTGIDRAQAERFLAEPLIEATHTAMRDARVKVARDGGARDAFGDWIDLATVAASIAHRPHAKPENSVLAQVAQSWELELMRPLVEILEAEAEKARPNVALACWLWDGAYLWIRQDAAAHLGRIKTACDRHARRLGIPTTLEVGE